MHARICGLSIRCGVRRTLFNSMGSRLINTLYIRYFMVYFGCELLFWPDVFIIANQRIWRLHDYIG